jgi:hypothetical protein
MTAKQIRAEIKALHDRVSEYEITDRPEAEKFRLDIELMQAYFLGEIAAQLAELNDREREP